MEIPDDSQNEMDVFDNEKWDFFICHASEDKLEVVNPLYLELKNRGMAVWLDQITLLVGDSLRKKIDEGLARSDFGIVILSRHFFMKEWTQKELGGLVQRETDGKKVILPVWHKVDHDYVARYSLILADKIAASTDFGIPDLVDKLLEAAGKARREVTPQIPLKKPAAAQVRISFGKSLITGHLHRYSLIVELKLVSPPDQGRLRIKLLWPEEIPISSLTQIREDSVRPVDGTVYRELVVNWDSRVFPGETAIVIGPDAPYKLEYEFNSIIHHLLYKKYMALRYSVFFEDHQPVSGTVPFSELNVF